MKSVVVLFAVLLMLIATPAVFDGIHGAETTTITQNLSGITTSGNYTANTTLGKPLFQNTIGSVISITSNNTLDSPTAYNYNSVSRILTVSGLAESDITRTLAVSFYIVDENLPSYSVTFLGLLRWFWILLMIGFTGASLYGFFSK